MPYKVFYLDIVETDIAEAKQWYASQQEGLGARFATAVKEAVESIEKRPLSYAVRHKNVRIAHTKVFPYNIHFYVDEDKKQAVIIGIVHGKKKDALFLDRW